MPEEEFREEVEESEEEAERVEEAETITEEGASATVEEEGVGGITEEVVSGVVQRLMFPKGKEFRYAFTALANVLQEANLIVDSEGIRLKSIDPSKVSLVVLRIPSTSLEEFEVSRELRIGLNFDIIKKILKRIKARQKVELSVDLARNRFYITIYTKKGRESGFYRRFGLPIINVAEEEIPEPQIEYPVRIRMDLETFIDLIASADELSDSVKLIAAEDSFTIFAEGEGGKALETTFPKDDPAFFEFHVEDGVHESTYSTEILVDFLRPMKQISRTVTIGFDTNKPLRLILDFAIGKIEFYLAPRVA